MSQYTYGEIMIGGKIPRSKIPGLIQAVNWENCCEGLDLGNPEEETSVVNLLKFVRNEETTGFLPLIGKLFFWKEDAYFGSLDTIRWYCQQNGIAYLTYLESDKTLEPFEIVED